MLAESQFQPADGFTCISVSYVSEVKGDARSHYHLQTLSNDFAQIHINHVVREQVQVVGD